AAHRPVVGGSRETRLRDALMDLSPGGAPDPRRVWRALPRRTCLEASAATELEPAATHRASAAARRTSPRPLEAGELGRHLKKTPKRRAHDRLHRRKGVEPASPPLPHLGTTWSDPGAAVPFQLEDHFR